MPEELNRILTDHLSSLLFTPTETATRNLTYEGITGDKVQQVGDVMYDAAMYYRHKAKHPQGISMESGFILSTIHRAENTDDPESLGNIIAALNVVAAETPVILPLHPRTRKLLSLGDYDTRNITLLDPVGYLEMVWLLEHCKLVVTDSGGLQKEAYFFGKPCVTTREETEWVELVENGWNSLASIRSSPNNLLALIVESNIKKCLLANTNLYGDGITGVLICEKF
jgi:UDP-GlcNAc3NAcA epimerase